MAKVLRSSGRGAFRGNVSLSYVSMIVEAIR
jgi:hypothetical protein